MACEDRYAYLYEEGYTSDEDDVSDSLVSGIVEEAFRREHDGNRNGRSEPQEIPGNADTFLIMDAQPSSEENLNRSFPRIQITEVTDESDFNENVVLTSLSADNCELKATRSASEDTLTERMVRFMPTTPQHEPCEKKKYPTTPKPVFKTTGPSLKPLKTKTDDNSPVQEDKQMPGPSLTSPADQKTPSSSEKFSCAFEEAQEHMMILEDQVASLSLALSNIEIRRRQSSGSKANSSCPRRSDSEGHFQYRRKEESEEALQEGTQLLQSFNLKWMTHKKLLTDLLSIALRREADRLRMERKIREQTELVLKLQQERRDLQIYLDEKEYEWMAVRKAFQADVDYIKAFLLDAKFSKEKSYLWHIVESLLRLHFNRQEALSMDINKQNKISELHLLLCRQQLHLAEVEEENRQLEHEIRDLIGGSAQEKRSTRRPSNLSDVLYCAHGLYSPTSSTNPQFASVKVFSLGGTHIDLPLEREKLVDSSQLFQSKVTEVSSEELARYDQKLLEDLTAEGPGSANFSLSDSVREP